MFFSMIHHKHYCEIHLFGLIILDAKGKCAYKYASNKVVIE